MLTRSHQITALDDSLEDGRQGVDHLGGAGPVAGQLRPRADHEADESGGRIGAEQAAVWPLTPDRALVVVVDVWPGRVEAREEAIDDEAEGVAA